MTSAGGDRRRDLITVVVLAGGQRDALADCLDGLSNQTGVPDPVVTVVDTAPSDGAAAVALGHPAVHWVKLTSEAGLRALCQRGIEGAPTPYVAFLNAAYRPESGWLASGLQRLRRGTEVIAGLDRMHCQNSAPAAGTRLNSLFLASYVASRIPFHDFTAADGDFTEDFLYKCRAAGFEIVIEDGCLPNLVRRATQMSRPIMSSASVRPSAGLPAKSAYRSNRSAVAAAETISVILCTNGQRREQLELCLKSLTALNDPNFEVIIVENAPTSSLARDPIGLAEARHVHEPQQGLDHARNRGVRESKGEIVAFIDDDCEADPGWLKGMREAFADPLVKFVTGRVRPAVLDLPSQQWFETRFPFDRGPYPQRFTRFDGGWSPLLMGAVGTGANMAYRREVLERVGDFDVALDMGTLIGGGGDLDMFARALAEGEVCQYAPSAVVFHHHRDNMTKLRWQTWGYGLSEGAMCAKYAVTSRGRRLHAAIRFLRLLRDHQRRLSAVRTGRDRYPRDLVVLEWVGIALGPIAYLLSVSRSINSRAR